MFQLDVCEMVYSCIQILALNPCPLPLSRYIEKDLNLSGVLFPQTLTRLFIQKVVARHRGPLTAYFDWKPGTSILSHFVSNQRTINWFKLETRSEQELSRNKQAMQFAPTMPNNTFIYNQENQKENKKIKGNIRNVPLTRKKRKMDMKFDIGNLQDINLES